MLLRNNSQLHAISLINAARGNEGLNTLVIEKRLMHIAANHAAAMAAKNT